ncbi:FkbM family methyltransferase [Macrococcus carouselicus]|uniref:FkbM family methyltransferase n=2 Tax=Macrococcus carouselicus TaxID=69969 RepID=A0A9Q8FK29_9STAP|nr:FkbM family methyltransferase [Macrococcus carouselicus]
MMKFKYVQNKKGLYRKIFKFGTVSYSHREEDMLINNLLRYAFKIDKDINYIDIGAGEPVLYSNTYYFYKMGHSGICVDPRKNVKKAFIKKRPRDTFLSLAIGEDTKTEKFHEFDLGLISTTNINDKEIYEEKGYSIKQTYDVQVVNINSILSKYFRTKDIHLMDIDIEGNEFKVLKTIDFEKYKPFIICIEVVNPKNGQHRDDTKNIVDYLNDNGYKFFADTISNLIFIRKDKLKNNYYGE